MTLVKYTAAGEIVQEVGPRTTDACRATVAGGTQNAPSATAVIVALPTEDFDTSLMHDLSTNNSRVTIKTSGLYQVEGFAESNTNPVSGINVINLFKNGALLGPDPYVLGTGSSQFSGRVRVSATVQLVAGDYLELQFINNGSGAVTIGRAYLSAVQIGSSAGVVPESWHYVGAVGEPAFSSGWSNHAIPLRFMKDPNGFVKFNGRVQSTGAGTPVFTLPVGYRAQVGEEPIFPIAYWGGSNRILGSLQVAGTGVVAVFNNADAAAAMTYVNLDVVHFRAEQ